MFTVVAIEYGTGREMHTMRYETLMGAMQYLEYCAGVQHTYAVRYEVYNGADIMIAAMNPYGPCI